MIFKCEGRKLIELNKTEITWKYIKPIYRFMKITLIDVTYFIRK